MYLLALYTLILIISTETVFSALNKGRVTDSENGLVNGIEIPGTHNKHRYISPDMFPSDMVDRIEVSKTLTPDMEGDAVAGVVNLAMKNAPEKMLIQANASAGYSQFFSENEFITFNSEVLSPRSPYELNENGYRASSSDFPTGSL